MEDMSSFNQETIDDLRSQALNCLLLGVPPGMDFNNNSGVQAFLRGLDISFGDRNVWSFVKVDFFHHTYFRC